jgi:hypothetical protein
MTAHNGDVDAETAAGIKPDGGSLYYKTVKTFYHNKTRNNHQTRSPWNGLFQQLAGNAR